jgi:hypothetical protein
MISLSGPTGRHQSGGVTSWRIILQEPGAVVAHVDGLLLQIWQGPAPTAANYDVVPPVLDDDARRHGRKPACLVIVAPSSQLPDRDARQKGATLPHHISAYVGVHEGNDFRSAALRMVLASIMILSREPLPSQIVSTVDEGCAAL